MMKQHRRPQDPVTACVALPVVVETRGVLCGGHDDSSGPESCDTDC